MRPNSGNVLNADSSSLLQYLQTNAHNVMRSVISGTLLVIPQNVEVPVILIQGYKYQ
jgi:hypothetical protein